MCLLIGSAAVSIARIFMADIAPVPAVGTASISPPFVLITEPVRATLPRVDNSRRVAADPEQAEREIEISRLEKEIRQLELKQAKTENLRNPQRSAELSVEIETREALLNALKERSMIRFPMFYQYCY
jgi:hypothetical protein